MGPKNLRKSIKLDGIHPTHWSSLNLTYCCEQCTHFNPIKTQCTLGYNCENHLKANQDKTYISCGQVAFCRFLEAD